MIKAFLVGVNKYRQIEYDNLDVCYSDASLVKTSLVTGLKILEENIKIIGETGEVTKSNIITEVSEFLKFLDEDDTAIVYFSGHGCRNNKKHYIVMSDDDIDLDVFLSVLKSSKASSIIVILDCCFSGGFSFNHEVLLEYEQMLSSFVGKGISIFASSKGDEESSVNLDNVNSYFTRFLTYSILAKFDIRKGYKSFDDIVSLTKYMIEIDSKKQDIIRQVPVYRSNIGGTYKFKVKEYDPYVSEEFFHEDTDYVIYSVEPVHHNTTKRYVVKVVLKKDMGITEVANVSHSIIPKVKNLNIYKSKKSEFLLKGRPANIIWLYFGLNESDMDGTFKYRITWVDETQDTDKWYLNKKHSLIYNDLAIIVDESYEFITKFIKDNTTDTATALQNLKSSRVKMIELAEKLKYEYSELRNESISKETFFIKSKDLAKEIHKCFFNFTDGDIPPKSIVEYDQLHENLYGTIHDMAISFVSDKWKESDKFVMFENNVMRYHNDLDTLKAFEVKMLDDV